MKNLLLIHLESLNYNNYMLNQNIFPTLCKLQNSGLFFERYYSTATSTLMVLGDLFYGGMEQYEQCMSLDDIPLKYPYTASLFDDLKMRGYHTGLYIHPEGSDRISAEKRHIAGFQNEMILKKDYKEFLRTLDEGMAHPPFALMACNYISNLSLNQYTDYAEYDWDIDSWEIGYHSLDRFVKDIIELLDKHILWDSTTVILYGDHGDDYWSHGLHQGLAHAIEPNELLIHTPLIILDPLVDPGKKSDKLISTIDLRSMIYDVIVKGDIPESVISDKQYVISRNEYAAQPMRRESFNKAYSVTDGHYLLMVSSGGLELYNVKMDNSCHNNFLKFFVLDNNLLRQDDNVSLQVGYHLKEYMTSRTQRILRQRFHVLWKELYIRVLELYAAAGLSEKQMIDELEFYHINYGR